MQTHPKITFWQPMIWIIGSGNHFTGKPLLGHESIRMPLFCDHIVGLLYYRLMRSLLFIDFSTEWVSSKKPLAFRYVVPQSKYFPTVYQLLHCFFQDALKPWVDSFLFTNILYVFGGFDNYYRSKIAADIGPTFQN